MDLSILIPARNEQFLARTVEDILSNIEGKTEIIVVLDGAWADPPIPDNDKVTIIYYNEPVGQRRAANEACRLSKAKYVMKVDAHCAFDKGFDVKMMAEMHDDWTMIPRMYNLHAFDWVCKCGHRIYQGPTPKSCEKCGGKMEKEMFWKPRLSRRSDFYRFDNTLHFQYFGDLSKRPQSQGDIVETMSAQGSCFMLTRKKYWELDICDEKFGSWGQQGTEVACKTWLSGGRLVTNRKTWYSHMFRTQGGDFGFPYPQSGRQVERARQYSRDLFLNNTWPKQIHPLSWLLEKFWPVPGWSEEDLAKLKTNTFIPKITKEEPKPVVSEAIKEDKLTKGLVYYTDNLVKLKIGHVCRIQLLKTGLPIVSCSLKPMNFGKNICLPLKKGYLTMFKQQLAALEASTADIIFFCEHDTLYSLDHFDFIPPRKDTYYYDFNWWRIRASDGFAVHWETHQANMLCAYRELLLKHFREKVRRIEKEGFSLRNGFEPGTRNIRRGGYDDNKADLWKAKTPSLDIRHENNTTISKWKKEDFRNQQSCQGWMETNDEIPGLGKTSDIILAFE